MWNMFFTNFNAVSMFSLFVEKLARLAFELIIPPLFSSVFVLLLLEKGKGALLFLFARGSFSSFREPRGRAFFLLKREE